MTTPHSCSLSLGLLAKDAQTVYFTFLVKEELLARKPVDALVPNQTDLLGLERAPNGNKGQLLIR